MADLALTNGNHQIEVEIKSMSATPGATWCNWRGEALAWRGPGYHQPQGLEHQLNSFFASTPEYICFFLEIK